MKELSIEEKAKAYDNIIKKANKMHSENCEACQMCIEELIPELKESGDERIRKALIEGFKVMNAGSYGECTFSNYNIPVIDIITWLEKQGNLVKYYEDKLDRCACDNFNKGYKKALEKQGEQNPISLEDAAKLFLEKLSESPYNNKPITDAQVITKELINFLKDTNTYNPNAINEQKPAEWSEEDELYIRELESLVKQVWATAEHKNDKDTIHKMSDLSFFLKTLKPQPQWKPNGFQLGGLSDAIIKYEAQGINAIALKELLEQLKKLTE